MVAQAGGMLSWTVVAQAGGYVIFFLKKNQILMEFGIIENVN